jgi:hypothetical protein
VKLGTGAGFTVRDREVELVKLPEVPVMVRLTVPVLAVLLAVRVKVLVLVALLGLNDAVTPVGKPEADKLTLLLNPFWGVIVIVLVPLAPRTTVKTLGDADNAKLGVVVNPPQLFTKFAALTVPMPVAKSQPIVAP